MDDAKGAKVRSPLPHRLLRIRLEQAPDPFSRLHDSYGLTFRIIDFIVRKFKGEPRVYSDDPKYCAALSPSALMLRHFSRKQEWPSTFVRPLDRKLTQVSLDDLKLAAKPAQPGQLKQPLLQITATVSNPILAAERWNATGIDLNKGTRYRFSLTKPLNVFDGTIHVTTLNGWPWCWQRIILFPLAQLRRDPSDPWFALIGSVDKKYNFRISHNGQEITAPATGELFCYFNDIDSRRFYRNNQGSTQLVVDTV